jgi:hypothetical protein
MITVTALGLDSQKKNVLDYGNGNSLTLTKSKAFSMPTEQRNVSFLKTFG